MKKLLSILMVGSLVLMLTACDPATGSDPSDTDSSVSDSSVSDSAITGGEDLDVSGGTIGDQSLKIVSVEKVKDTDGNDAVVVTINWKNGGDKATSFGSAVAVKVLQGETKLVAATVEGSAESIAASLKDVAPGSAATYKEAYVLANDSDDVKVELTEAFGAKEGEVVTETLPLA